MVTTERSDEPENETETRTHAETATGSNHTTTTTRRLSLVRERYKQKTERKSKATHIASFARHMLVMDTGVMVLNLTPAKTSTWTYICDGCFMPELKSKLFVFS
ncbi:hypothetical protein M8C21_015325 [Ambrosia artemisiifolia]|uniref:Uncharacterized protein n=1 Tax=Ambrosia artemisiifolia TaxID=4212 RepID=A0AAD5D9A1_AMBAR|nr:hypothetical protein M8C21_015325 [Ambrosia artemisiifolia]